MSELAIGGVVGQLRPQEKRDQQVLRVAAGQVQTIDDTNYLVSVTVHGWDDTTIEGVGYHPLAYIPRIGENVWIGKFGIDWWVIGVISRSMFGSPTLGRVPSARIDRTSDLSIAHNTAMAVSMQAKEWDTNGMVDLATNPTRITLNRVGLWMLTAGMNWESNATGRRILDIKWVGSDFITRDEHALPGSGFWSGNCSAQVRVGIGGAASRHYAPIGSAVEMVVFQTSGAGLLIAQGSIPCFLAATWLGPNP